tara:strand:+ start:4187 stop:4960 length:774 start_codon:yes stop_codon:yes gene_type:complete
MIDLKNKKILVIGIASERSIASGIAKTLGEAGADLVLTYQNEKLKSRVQSIADQISSSTHVYECDLSSDEAIKTLQRNVEKDFKEIDIIIHSAAYAPREELSGDFLDNITREGFKVAHDISSYSFAAVAKEFKSIIRPGGSLITLSYLGSERVIQNYNVMGLAKASLEANVRYMANSLGEKQIRVNAISAGPIKTLAASGIKGFGEILKHVEDKAPLKRNISLDDISNVGLFLSSDLSSGITGQVIYVDCGFSINGF